MWRMGHREKSRAVSRRYDVGIASVSVTEFRRIDRSCGVRAGRPMPGHPRRARRIYVGFRTIAESLADNGHFLSIIQRQGQARV